MITKQRVINELALLSKPGNNLAVETVVILKQIIEETSDAAIEAANILKANPLDTESLDLFVLLRHKYQKFFDQSGGIPKQKQPWYVQVVEILVNGLLQTEDKSLTFEVIQKLMEFNGMFRNDVGCKHEDLSIVIQIISDVGDIYWDTYGKTGKFYLSRKHVS